MDFVKKVNPAPISNIQFFKDAGIERTRKRKRDDTKTFPKATESEKHSFLGAISKCKTKPIVLSTFYGYSESFHWKKNPVKSPQLPLSLRTLYQETGKDVTDISEEIMDKAMKKIAISKEQSQFICETTKAQSDSLVWREQRIGRITSSNVHRVLHTDQDNPSQSLVLSICTQSRDFKTEATKWGKDHEAVALKEYEKLMKTSHTDFDINPTGLLISPDYAFVGASADSVSSCSCHGKRVVEVKCPFTHRESTLQEYLVHKSSCLGTSPHIHIKETHSYFSQVQLQMMVHDVSLADFVIWTPKFTILVHVPRNIKFIEKMKTIIVPFYRRHILPELLTRKLESSKSAPLKENTPPKLYCFCQKPESGDMIGCDEPKCSYQWFHMSCVKLKKGPKHSWYCKDCRKDRQTKK